MVDAVQQPLALSPPAPPTDLIQSALFLPLSRITKEHAGRKIRTIGQILGFNPASSVLLLCAPTTSSSPTPIPTLLVNLTTPLLGQSPAATDLSDVSNGVYWHLPKPMNAIIQRDEGWVGPVNREILRLDRGQWVVVVGWLEVDGRRIPRKKDTRSSYAPPISVVLEAIHVAPTREPPVGSLYRGEVLTGDGRRTGRTEQDNKRPSHGDLLEHDEGDGNEQTPRPNRTRPQG